MNAGYTRVVTNAGSLQVGDVVFEHKERIVEIYKQTHSECFCQLRWTGNDQHGSVRYHVINTVNALTIVTAGPTLDAANAVDGDLPKRGGDGLPIYWREHWHKETLKAKAKAPRIEVQFVRFNPFDAGNEYAERTDVERAIAFCVDFTAMLNNGWRVTCEMFDGQIFTARLEREVRS